MSGHIYFEIQADEPERAANFYNEVFGWKPGKSCLPKKLTRQRDLLNTERRTLPMMKIEKEYISEQIPHITT